MIKAVAIDDEPLALQVMKAFCSKVEYIDLQKTFTDTKEALRYLKQYPVDLLFLDIRMPGMSGIELYKAVSQNCMVIFTTAFSEYAVEGFNLQAIDYLVKPIELARFRQATDKAYEYYKHLNNQGDKQEKALYVRSEYSLVKIPYENILYIEGLDNYVKIHQTTGKYVMVRMSMKAMQEKLPESEFIRVHRSYIIPLAKVQSVRNRVITIGSNEIPIGTNYVESTEQLLKGK
jgi:DNA-binding LytR/AlgR family response regulator